MHELRFRFLLYNFTSIVEYMWECACHQTHRTCFTLPFLLSIRKYFTSTQSQCYTKTMLILLLKILLTATLCDIHIVNKIFLLFKVSHLNYFWRLCLHFNALNVCLPKMPISLRDIFFGFWIEIIFTRRWFSHQLANVNYQYRHIERERQPAALHTNWLFWIEMGPIQFHFTFFTFDMCIHMADITDLA